MPVVEAIHVYPVKSCRAVAVDGARVDRTGLAGDRFRPNLTIGGTEAWAEDVGVPTISSPAAGDTSSRP